MTAHETLRQKQSRFIVMLARLILWADANGYALTVGEAWRPPAVAALYAEQGRGIANSLHIVRLAVDMNLFVGGEWISDGADPRWEPLGREWERLGGTWGGRWKRKDSNHFSLAHGGRA